MGVIYQAFQDALILKFKHITRRSSQIWDTDSCERHAPVLIQKSYPDISVNLFLSRSHRIAPYQHVMLTVFVLHAAGSNVEDSSKCGRKRSETMTLMKEGEVSVALTLTSCTLVS